jgi:hypothetical protein
MNDAQTPPKKGPFQQVKPRWIAENLALAALGFGLGHVAGGGAAGLAAGHPAVQKLSPEAKRRVVQTAQALGGVGGAGTAFALNQMRLAMNERLLRKRLEQEELEKKRPTPEKVASVLRTRGWR